MACIVCGSEQAMGKYDFNRDLTRVLECPRCGAYAISDECAEDIPGVQRVHPAIRRKLARYLYETRGQSDRLLTSYPVAEGRWPGPVMDLGTARKLYEKDDLSALQKYEGALRRLSDQQKPFGYRFTWSNDRWAIPTMDDKEADRILRALAVDGYLILREDADGMSFSLTKEGLVAAQHPAPLRAELPAGTGPERAYRIFLSHSHQDKQFVEHFARDLHRHSIDVWYDGWDLDIGHDLTVKIQEGIQQSDLLAVILSPAAVRSPWVEKEWTTAFNRELAERRCVVLPILHKDCDMPAFLHGKVYADFRRPEEYEERLADFVRCLRGESKRPPRQ